MCASQASKCGPRFRKDILYDYVITLKLSCICNITPCSRKWLEYGYPLSGVPKSRPSFVTHTPIVGIVREYPTGMGYMLISNCHTFPRTLYVLETAENLTSARKYYMRYVVVVRRKHVRLQHGCMHFVLIKEKSVVCLISSPTIFVVQ